VIIIIRILNDVYFKAQTIKRRLTYEARVVALFDEIDKLGIEYLILGQRIKDKVTRTANAISAHTKVQKHTESSDNTRVDRQSEADRRRTCQCQNMKNTQDRHQDIGSIDIRNPHAPFEKVEALSDEQHTRAALKEEGARATDLRAAVVLAARGELM
jgi:hypothetical protein